MIMRPISVALVFTLMIVASQRTMLAQASSNNNDNGNDNDDRNALHDLGDAANEAGDGNSAGRETARNDYSGGQSHNDYCPQPGEMAWCTGYIAGYNAVWLSLKVAEG